LSNQAFAYCTSLGSVYLPKGVFCPYGSNATNDQWGPFYRSSAKVTSSR